jgi:porin
VRKTTTLVAAATALASGMQAYAYQVNDKLSINAVMAAAGQCQSLSGDHDSDNECRGAVPFQPEVSFHPTETDEFSFKLGFATGNGLNNNTPFTIAPWAADLEDDVKDINGRNRDYLLTAWYKHTFQFGEDHSVGTSFGIIDATDYLDGVAYANDEYTQFMNGILTNASHVFLPSYDAGGAVEWQGGPWSLTGVFMSIGENDDGEGYEFYGLELGYTLETGLGEGNYKFLVDATSKDFSSPAGHPNQRLKAMLVTLDQELGDVFGVFARIGRQGDDAAIDYESIISGGLDIKGRAWGRAQDNIGIGYAYLDGGNLDLNHTHVAEAYYRFAANDYLALSADVQYMKDDHKEEDSPKGFILGLRATAEF